MNRTVANAALAAALAVCGCSMFDSAPKAAFERNLAPWGAFAFISPADGLPEGDCHAAAFSKTYVNRSGVKRATVWATALGCFELYVNGSLVSVSAEDGRADFLRPGFTDGRKRRSYLSYDVTELWKRSAADANDVSAFVARSWFSDKIGSQSKVPPSFAAKLELEFEDGTAGCFDTGADWFASTDTPFVRAGIYEGERYDARKPRCAKTCAGETHAKVCTDFKGVVTAPEGALVRLREDLALAPVEMYVWKDAEGAVEGKCHGKVKVLRTYGDGDEISLAKGERLIVDFGQNASAVPRFTGSAASGTSMSMQGAEMLNDGNGEISRGNDGPGGSVYRLNYRSLKGLSTALYTFAGKDEETYTPTFTFQGYRYMQIFADGDVKLSLIRSIPVTSIAKADECGSLETGDEDVNKLIRNVLWGQYSNYLSVPTDCPQRDERHGWTADTQVFSGAAYCNADVYDFHRKWMRDMRDSQENGLFPSVSPFGGYGHCGLGKLGWADAGVIVPWTAWRMTGRTEIIDENFAAMEAYLDAQDKALGNLSPNENYSDWLAYESVPKNLKKEYWAYLSACYWMQNARYMEEMCKATGRDGDRFAAMAAKARAHLKKLLFDAKGVMKAPYCDMQTPQLFAFRLGLYDDSKEGATAATKALNANFRLHEDCLQTGFLGTSIIMDTLTYDFKRPDLAYTLLLQHENPSWLYSVDQGATTIWERWNSYTKSKGFGNAGMNSFNHYAYGVVLQWMYGTMAGIQPGPNGGFDDEFVLAPIPDSRVGHVTATYRTKRGVIKTHWHYEGNRCVFKFTVPDGAKASVKFGGTEAVFEGGDYTLDDGQL